MRTAVCGAVVGVVLSLAAVVMLAPRNAAMAQSSELGGAPRAGESLIAFSSQAGEGKQVITVIDPRQRVLSVYQVDTAVGTVALKSVRNIHWDLQMDEYNSAGPAPREIRALLQQR